jgi:hypothetical protein
MTATARPITTYALLHQLADGPPGDTLSLQDLMTQFHRRAFGMLLLAGVLPAFIPLPVGAGAVSGPLVMLIGLQLLLTLRRPWLPRWLGRRGPHRSALQRFVTHTGKAFQWIERWVKPRLDVLIAHPLATIYTGLLLLALGFLLSLPIPFTNYPFGLLLLAFAVALIERDGVLMAVAWGFGTATTLAFGLLSEAVANWMVQTLG